MTAAKKEVTIYTDGACSGNPGPGGWGAILRFGEHEKELNGGEFETTNNKMELTAAIEALNALKESCLVNLRLEAQWLENIRQKTCQKRRALARTRTSARPP